MAKKCDGSYDGLKMNVIQAADQFVSQFPMNNSSSKFNQVNQLDSRNPRNWKIVETMSTICHHNDGKEIERMQKQNV